MISITKTIYRFDEKDKKNILKQLIDLDINSIRKLSKLMSYSHNYVCLVLNGQKNVKDEFINKLKGLNICL